MLRGVIASGVACLCMLSIVYVLGIVCALGIVCVRLTLVPSSRRTMAELASDHGSAGQPLKRDCDQQRQAQDEATNRKFHNLSIQKVDWFANDRLESVTNKLCRFSKRFCPMIGKH